MDRIGSEFMHDACKESEKLKLAFSHEETAYTPADSILGDYWRAYIDPIHQGISSACLRLQM